MIMIILTLLNFYCPYCIIHLDALNVREGSKQVASQRCAHKCCAMLLLMPLETELAGLGMWLMWLIFFFQTPTFCNSWHQQGAFHCISNNVFIYMDAVEPYVPPTNSKAKIRGKAQVQDEFSKVFKHLPNNSRDIHVAGWSAHFQSVFTILEIWVLRCEPYLCLLSLFLSVHLSDVLDMPLS